MIAIDEYRIHFPEIEAIEQGEEYIIVEQGGNRERIRFHDYDRIYDIPGLYEYLFYDRYKCNSPEVVCGLLEKQLGEDNDNIPAPLAALDIGAGNGMVGEQLRGLGADAVVGIDIIEEAKEAVVRDRPDVYTEYHVADLTDLSPSVRESLARYSFNCMTIVAALGFGDIPPRAFAGGFNLIKERGWIAFNIKEDFVGNDDKSGFAQLIERLEKEGVLEIQRRYRYRHRFCQDGEPLYYYAVVGRKMADIEEEMLSGLKA